MLILEVLIDVYVMCSIECIYMSCISNARLLINIYGFHFFDCYITYAYTISFGLVGSILQMVYVLSVYNKKEKSHRITVCYLYFKNS